MRARLSYSDITKCTEDFKGAGGWRAASHAATCSVRFSAISEIQAVDGTFQCKGKDRVELFCIGHVVHAPFRACVERQLISGCVVVWLLGMPGVL